MHLPYMSVRTLDVSTIYFQLCDSMIPCDRKTVADHMNHKHSLKLAQYLQEHSPLSSTLRRGNGGGGGHGSKIENDTE